MPRERHARARRLVVLAVSGAVLLVLTQLATAAIGGGLKQLAGTKGCIVDETTTPSGCEDVRALQGIGQMAISPNGAQVYVPAQAKDAIVVFNRDPVSGALTQKSGPNGCYTSNAAVAAADGCATVTLLTGARAVALSPNGDDLFVATSQGRLVAFDLDVEGNLTSRNSSNFCGDGCDLNSVRVSADGFNIYVAGPGGSAFNGIIGVYRRDAATGGIASFRHCFARQGGCEAQLPLLMPVGDLEITPDDKQVIITTGENACCNWAVLAFDRATAGAIQGDLTAPASASRCATGNPGLANCQLRTGMTYPTGLAIADGGRSIHVSSNETLTTISRDPATGNLVANPADRCATYVGSGYVGCTAVANVSNFTDLRGVAVTPDEANLYVASRSGNGGIWAFSRNPVDGSFSLKPKPLGCVLSNSDEGCSTLRGGVSGGSVVAAPGNRHVYMGGANRLYSFSVDRAPTCQNASASTAYNTAVTVQLSCSDPDGEAVAYEIVTGPAKGTLGAIQPNGTVTYGPLLGTSGTDTFTYRAVAVGVPSDAATVTVSVAAAAPPPPPAPAVRCTVPKVVGLKLAAAKTRIRRARCSVGRVRSTRAKRAKRGRVIKQSPRAGAVRARGAKVTLVVGRK